ncbi:hypothetical protein ABRP59_14425 [Pectobacterium punjabense]|uniref:hypothetical protein n=1 Tax=Pectobacterium punjabense TaxID=2108399 RepID=UPI0032EE8571
MNSVNPYYIIVEVFLTDIDGKIPLNNRILYLIIDVANGRCIGTFASFNSAVSALVNFLSHLKLVENFKEILQSSKFQFYSLCILNESSEIQSHHALLAKNDIANLLITNYKINKNHDITEIINTCLDKYILEYQLTPPTP